MKGARTPPLEARYYDLPKRVASMNRQGVAVQALSLTAPMVYWAQGELGRRLAREWNDGASAAHTAYPDRFVVCATLPMQDTTLALAELDRAARLPGVRARLHGHQRQRPQPLRPRVLPGVRALRRRWGCRWGCTRSTSTGRSGSSPTT